MNITPGSTDNSIIVQLFDNTNGSPKTGLTYDSAGVNISYARSGTARVAVTEADLASPSAAYASGGFKEIDPTNMPGDYRFDIPNAAVVVNANMVTLKFMFDGVRSRSINVNLNVSTYDHYIDLRNKSNNIDDKFFDDGDVLLLPQIFSVTENTNAILNGNQKLDLANGQYTIRDKDTDNLLVLKIARDQDGFFVASIGTVIVSTEEPT